MSHWNPLEKQLRSWTPRKPSPSLEARLFPQASAQATALDDAQERPANPAAWHWLAPAMAVFIFGLFLFGNNPGAFHHFDAEANPAMLATAAALAQPDYATYYADVRHGGNNTLRSTFEWTNDSRSLTTTPPVAQTNSVRQ